MLHLRQREDGGDEKHPAGHLDEVHVHGDAGADVGGELRLRARNRQQLAVVRLRQKVPHVSLCCCQRRRARIVRALGPQPREDGNAEAA